MVQKFEPCYICMYLQTEKLYPQNVCLKYMKLRENFIPTDRKTLSTKILPILYETERERVGTLLESAPHYACTTDIWISRAQHCLYVSLSVHYLSTDFTLQTHVLESKEFLDSHSGVNLHEINSSLQGYL